MSATLNGLIKPLTCTCPTWSWVLEMDRSTLAAALALALGEVARVGPTMIYGTPPPWMGHASIATTNLYGHHLAISRIGRGWSG